MIGSVMLNACLQTYRKTPNNKVNRSPYKLQQALGRSTALPGLCCVINISFIADYPSTRMNVYSL